MQHAPSPPPWVPWGAERAGVRWGIPPQLRAGTLVVSTAPGKRSTQLFGRITPGWLLRDLVREHKAALEPRPVPSPPHPTLSAPTRGGEGARPIPPIGTAHRPRVGEVRISPPAAPAAPCRARSAWPRSRRALLPRSAPAQSRATKTRRPSARTDRNSSPPASPRRAP